MVQFGVLPLGLCYGTFSTTTRLPSGLDLIRRAAFRLRNIFCFSVTAHEPNFLALSRYPLARLFRCDRKLGFLILTVTLQSSQHGLLKYRSLDGPFPDFFSSSFTFHHSNLLFVHPTMSEKIPALD